MQLHHFDNHASFQWNIKKWNERRKASVKRKPVKSFTFFHGNVAFIEENPFLRKSTIACIQERPARNSYSVFYKAKDSSPDEFGYLGDPWNICVKLIHKISRLC